MGKTESELSRGIRLAEDDYLVGISNKGIVKRSHKDLESSEVVFKNIDTLNTEEGNELFAVVQGENCKLQLPLAESKCSCPSRSMCKHIIMCIIRAREELAAGDAALVSDDICAGAETAGDTRTRDASVSGDIRTGTEVAADGMTADAELASDDKKNRTTASGIEEGEKRSIESSAGQLIQELQAVTIKEFQKKAGAKQYKKLTASFQTGKQPVIQKGNSVVTVTDPVEGTEVKLLSPLAYSSCTCHKKEDCYHKLKAILCVKLALGLWKKEELDAETVQKDFPFDILRIQTFCENLLSDIQSLLFTGVVHLTGEDMYRFERYAVEAHNLLLANYEVQLRRFSDSIQGYHDRRVQISSVYLLREISGLYESVKKLLFVVHGISEASGASPYQELAALAGVFRSDYLPVTDLTLIGLGMRHLKTAAGYEGNEAYFIEERTGEFYTYNVMRPVFYDKQRRTSRTGAGEVPWNLACTFSQMAVGKVKLHSGKANERHRLSSSVETEAEYLGPREQLSSIQHSIYDDFDRLWKAYFEDWQEAQRLEEDERLALIQPAFVKRVGYDEIRQQLRVNFIDIHGNCIAGVLKYSAEEKTAINELERLVEKLEHRKQEPPVFLGILYIENGRLCMYPIETVGE